MALRGPQHPAPYGSPLSGDRPASVRPRPGPPRPPLPPGSGDMTASAAGERAGAALPHVSTLERAEDATEGPRTPSLCPLRSLPLLFLRGDINLVHLGNGGSKLLMLRFLHLSKSLIVLFGSMSFFFPLY